MGYKTTKDRDRDRDRDREMDTKQAGASLDALISSFNTRIGELQELVIGRNMYAATSIPDLTAVNTAVKAIEFQMQAIKERIRQETEAIPKAKKLVDTSLNQQKKLRNMFAYMPSTFPPNTNPNYGMTREKSSENLDFRSLKIQVEPTAVLHKEKKGRNSAPIWYLSAEELDSLSSYMKGRLTLDKVNAAINDMATYADTNAHLIAAPKKKLPENTWEKALKVREIAMNEAVKGNHFFLESDIKGPTLKLDNSGRAILTVLRHLGRINEARVGQQRLLILSKPH